MLVRSVIQTHTRVWPLFFTPTLNSLNLPLSHSVLLSHHSHFLNLPITLSISLSSHSNSPTCSQSRSRSPSQSCSRFVLSLLLTLCTLTLGLHLQFGITRYVSLSEYLFEHLGVRVICGYMSVFVG